jgi:DNA-directed RNA polymerase specialized sigma24 family protein
LRILLWIGIIEDIVLRINTLYTDALNGDKTAEEKLFRYLLDRFRYSVHHRIWDKDEAEEIVQEAMLVVAQEYRGIEFQASFAAWAFKVVDNRILSYIKKRKQAAGKFVEHSDFSPSMTDTETDPILRRMIWIVLKRWGKQNYAILEL